MRLPLLFFASMAAVIVGCGGPESTARSPGPAPRGEPTEGPREPARQGTVAERPADFWPSLVDAGPRKRPTDVRDLPGPVYFAEASADLDAQAVAILDEVARLLRERAAIRRVVLLGYADASEGDETARGAIGRRRSEAVRDALVERGIDEGRLHAAAGPTRVSPNAPTDPESRRRVRQVSIDVVDPPPARSPSP